MKASEYVQYDGLGLAELVRNGDAARHELVACASAINEQVNPKINAVIEEFDELDALPESTGAAFDGVPFLVKDIVCHIGGRLHEMGSRLSAGVSFEHDTDLMQSFRKAGLVTIGRTTTPEFGFNITAESVLTGVTRNPWDLTRMPGGSSGGAAAAVAAGVVPLAHANDGGGSIRIPASCCGLVGLKPTRGRITSAPDGGEGLNGMGIEFAVTRTVRDSAALLDAVHGPGVGDPYIIPPPTVSYSSVIQSRPRKLRIAFSDEPWSGVPVDTEVKKALHDTATLCEALGHDVTMASPAIDYEVFSRCQSTLWTANIASWVTNLSEQTGRRLNLDTMEAATFACYEHGMRLSVLDIYRALGEMNQVTRAVAPFFLTYDVLLTPTTAKIPQLVGTYNQNAPVRDALEWVNHIFSFAPFTALFNVTGQPAISLPLQRTSGDLAIGMQFVGSFADEATLLALARQLEEAAPWPQIAPMVAQLVQEGVLS